MKSIKVTLILIVVAAFFIACTESPKKETAQNLNKPIANETEKPATPVTDELALGRDHYKEQCAKCHKDDGTGGKVEIEGKTIKPDNLTTEKMANEPDEEYIKYMVEGIPDEGMPPFKDILSEDDMKEVVKYIRAEFQGKK